MSATASTSVTTKCAVLTVLLAASISPTNSIASGSQEVSAADGPTYQFKYHVNDLNTKDYKTHEEVGENGLVHGTYTVREPSGDLRVVSYTAGDEKGFQAMVRVRPTSLSQSETEISSLLLKNKQVMIKSEGILGSDEPLKIALNTERRVHKTQEHHTKSHTATNKPQLKSSDPATDKPAIKRKVLQYPTAQRPQAKNVPGSSC